MTTRRETQFEEPGRIVATGGRCRNCGASMLRREVRPGFRWICTNADCGATQDDRPRHRLVRRSSGRPRRTEVHEVPSRV